MTWRYDEILADLRTFYDDHAPTRETMVKQQFKLDERAVFLDRLAVVEARTLLDIGAGTGEDSAYFQAAGLEVSAIDVSPEMVRRARLKGVSAKVGDILHLDTPTESVDAVYAMNVLLHIPNTDLPAVLTEIHRVLRPGGLVYIGLWGGRDEEGFKDADELPRFFSWRTDKTILGYVQKVFEVLDFHTIDDFQSITLVRPVDF